MKGLTGPNIFVCHQSVTTLKPLTDELHDTDYENFLHRIWIWDIYRPGQHLKVCHWGVLVPWRCASPAAVFGQMICVKWH